MASTRVSPSTAATLILAANPARKSAAIHNVGGVDVYLGSDGNVSAATGLRLAPGATLHADVDADAWWGITSATVGDLRVLEVV